MILICDQTAKGGGGEAFLIDKCCICLLYEIENIIYKTFFIM